MAHGWEQWAPMAMAMGPWSREGVYLSIYPLQLRDSLIKTKLSVGWTRSQAYVHIAFRVKPSRVSWTLLFFPLMIHTTRPSYP
jgi:hypothetical protein